MSTGNGRLDADMEANQSAIGAIRLAIEGAANDQTALTLIKWLIEQAPETPPKDVYSVQLFIEGIRALEASFTT